jgi:hypothetical protein
MTTSILSLCKAKWGPPGPIAEAVVGQGQSTRRLVRGFMTRTFGVVICQGASESLKKFRTDGGDKVGLSGVSGP